MRKQVSAWILVLVLFCFQGCALAEKPMVDRAGSPISVPDEIQTIVSLAPSVTQVVVDLGMADKLVAVDTYSQGMQGVPADLPGFDMMALDAEQLLALAADVVFVSGMTLVDDAETLAKLTDMGVQIVLIPSSDSIEGILQDNLFIGEVLGDAEGAAALNAPLVAAIEALTARKGEPLKVYFEISPSPYLYSFGTGVFLNEMIELAGGVNILADLNSWLSISEEAVIAANPDVIFTNVNWEPNAVEEILGRKGWENVGAIQKGQVYLIDADASSQPNHRIVYALNEMTESVEKSK